ncbi:HNH endonuclease [Staphylococcus hominis]|uniref:HNH endonuclease n=1 Tax=Staphylococcus hominis TaxID=1290 RepID=UPI0018EA3F9D|nr:HNH endonuclease [Staphylococcus hominis]MBJ6365417.1 HNH endonuclease [Staphylococcus hominis]
MLEYILSETILINDNKTQNKLSILDIDLNELNEHEQDERELEATNSDENLAENALKMADFKCEGVNIEKGEKEHFVFARKANPEITYTEPHYLIPLSNHKDFENSLDVEANIMSLCSNCHKLIHYGKDYKQLLEILYKQRKDKLKECGIEDSWEQLLSCYI